MFIRRLIIVLISLVVSALVLLALTEVYLRAYKPIQYTTAHFHDYFVRTYDETFYEPKPNKGPFNAQSIRDERNFSIPKPDHTYRIEVIGDSLAFGYGLDSSQTFSKKLEEKLNATGLLKRTYEVMNFGVPGYNISQTLTRLTKKGLNYSPDTVVYWYWFNDAYVDDGWMASTLRSPILQVFQHASENGGKNSGSQTDRNIAKLLDFQLTRYIIEYIQNNSDIAIIRNDPKLSDYKKALTPKILSLYDAYVQKFTLGAFKDLGCCDNFYMRYTDFNNFIFFNYHIKEFASVCKIRGISCVILLTPVLYSHSGQTYNWLTLHRLITSVIHEYGLPVLDLTPEFEKYDGGVLRVSPLDPEHPNAFGNQIVADSVYTLITADKDSPISD